MLANLEPNRPRQSSLRRSISASYYALFHALTYEWSRCFRASVRPSARRMLDHGKAKAAAQRMGGSNSSLRHMTGSPSCPPLLASAANDFVVLQEFRHKADYNFSMNFSRQDSLQMHSRAERSINGLISCRQACPCEMQAFLLEMQGVRVN